MPKLDAPLTDKNVGNLPSPTKGYVIWLDPHPERKHFGVRVTPNGTKAWILERRLEGKTVRRTLGVADGPRALTVKQALKQLSIINGQLAGGLDEVAEDREARRAEAAQQKEETLTLDAAIREYVEKKVRMKDNKPIGLKARTKADYLEMIEPGGTRLNGQPKVDGALFLLANKSLTKITGAEVKELHDNLAKHAPRRAGYAMQVLRAVMKWKGIELPDSPMGKVVPECDRIVLRTTGGKANPIKSKYLGAWWRSACAAGSGLIGGSKDAADYYRFQLLTGCRGVEITGDEYDNQPIHVRDVDLAELCILRTDTKNRRDHTIWLSTQALEIVKRRMEGKKPDDVLFEIADPRKTLRAINKGAGLKPDAHSGHDLRATFASTGACLVDQFSLKKMLNHSNSGDVTAEHYIDLDDEHLRAAWQKVADFIEAAAVVKIEEAA